MTSMPTLNPAGSQLKSHKAYREILDWIQEGRYGAGERLPSERELAERLGFNHLTVRRGLAKLVDEGVIEKRPHVGNFVSDNPRVAPLALLLPEYLHANLAAHPWTGLITSGACSSLDPMQFSLSTLYYTSNRLWEDTGRAMVNAGVKGALLAPDSSVQPEHVRRLLDQGIQVVALQDSAHLAVLGLPVVQPDFEVTLAQLIHGLAERGHRHIKVAMYDCNPLRESLLTTLRIVLRQTGLGSLEDVLLNLDNRSGVSLPETYSAMGRVLESHDRPTAIVVPDEFAAADLFQTCYRLNLRVPRDLSVAAVLDSTPHVYPVPLTAPDSVQVARLVGKLAVSQLTSLIENGLSLQRQTLLRNEIVWRDSVATLER